MITVKHSWSLAIAQCAAACLNRSFDPLEFSVPSRSESDHLASAQPAGLRQAAPKPFLHPQQHNTIPSTPSAPFVVKPANRPVLTKNTGNDRIATGYRPDSDRIIFAANFQQGTPSQSLTSKTGNFARNNCAIRFLDQKRSVQKEQSTSWRAHAPQSTTRSPHRPYRWPIKKRIRKFSNTGKTTFPERPPPVPHR